MTKFRMGPVSPAIECAGDYDPSADSGTHRDVDEALAAFRCAPSRLRQGGSIGIVLYGNGHTELGLKFCNKVAPLPSGQCPHVTHDPRVGIERSRASDTEALECDGCTRRSLAKHAFDPLNSWSKSLFRWGGTLEASDNLALFGHRANGNLCAADVHRSDDLFFAPHFPPLSSTLFLLPGEMTIHLLVAPASCRQMPPGRRRDTVRSI
jgi:hypothetical protein